ncbi:hypothetical protein [Massilia sp. CCM 8734]|uniref:hypothetical protein n=1 Tax=Massilia sp. CCM 8734 TaxID=2609283 RepID=UPI0014228CC0|nr:hypothetical protein [Massilia sp. CCM 8734]NHZ94606.1 hypothetical protein [Massilia sp. CCM 8734]
MDDDYEFFMDLSAKLSTHKFLLGQLYAQIFIADPESMKTLPESLIDAAKFKSHPAQVTDDEQRIELQARIVQQLGAFFADVENRVIQARDR